MKKPPKRDVLRVTAGVFASAVLALVIYVLWVSRGQVSLSWFGRPVDLLEPGWLLGIALAPMFFVMIAYSLTDVSMAQQILSASLRSVLFGALMVALARPVWTSKEDRIALVVAVEVSDSVSDAQLAAASRYVADLRAHKRSRDQVQVVTFAKRPRALAEREAISREHADGSATNLQAAIQLSYGLFPDGFLPRLVLVSDGMQTEGDVGLEAARARDLGVQVSWMQFPEERIQEIRIAEMRLPDEIKEGAPFEVKAKILSTHREEVTLTLRQDDFPNGLEPKKTVQLEEGVNWVTFRSQAKRSGFVTYTMTIVDPKADKEKSNNQSILAAPVKGQPRVLYVEGSQGRVPGVASYMKSALKVENIEVEVRAPSGMPSTAKDLEKYDLVLVSDVPMPFMGTSQMMALDTYVRTLGGGLIVAGGEDSFGSGGYQGTTIEKMMPVRFDSETTREQPNVAILLVMDRSGSMAGAKIEAAKESARATVEVLSPSDLVGVIAFDSQPSTIVRLQRASNRMRISNEIARLTASGGTDIYPAMIEAFQLLQTANARVKHVILLSDGQAPRRAQLAALSKDMFASNITVSSVGIGDADRGLLQEIAEEGNGRLYMVEDLAALPRIFMKETIEAKRSALVEDRVSVRVAKRVDMIEGTGVGSAPPLRGYVSTKAKPTAETILISDFGEPILARWRFGAGTSVAWTSDVKNRWSVDWLRWGNFPKFWAQVIRSSMRRKSYDSYDMQATIDGGRARVTVDAIDDSEKGNQEQFVNNHDTTLEIIDPATSRAERTIPMDQTAAGRYTAVFDVDRYGTYMLKAVHRRDGQVVAESLGSVALPYPPEYLFSKADPAPLMYAAKVTGGDHAREPKRVFEPGSQSISYRKDLWPWVVLFAACLLALDTLLKRVRLFGYRVIRFS